MQWLPPSRIQRLCRIALRNGCHHVFAGRLSIYEPAHLTHGHVYQQLDRTTVQLARSMAGLRSHTVRTVRIREVVTVGLFPPAIYDALVVQRNARLANSTL